MDIKFNILNDYDIRSYRPKTKNSLLIRCLEPYYKKDGIPYEIKFIKEYKDVLTLYFQDIKEEIKDKPKHIKTFEIVHVLKIIRFLNKNKKIEEIVIHCNMGQSRSPAIMLGIIKLLKNGKINLKIDNINSIEEQILKEKYYTPNSLVLKNFDNYIENNNIIKKESKTIKNVLKKFLKFNLLILLMLFIGITITYFYLNKTEGLTIYFHKYNINKEYGRYLIEINDSFIDKMVLFEKIAIDGKKVELYTDDEKEKLKNIIIAENSILSRLDKTKPKDINLDYNEIHQNMMEAYALYLQGQIMKLEYIYQTNEGLSNERFTIGDSVTNLTGNFIIEYDQIINNVRKTNYYMKYTVMDGLKLNLGDVKEEKIEKDKNGNIIIDKNKNYLYTPNSENENINKFINDFNRLNK